MLSEIREGKNLKKAEKPSGKLSQHQKKSLANVMNLAMEERRKAMKVDVGDEDEDQWDEWENDN
jgi:hypothetical protein